MATGNQYLEGSFAPVREELTVTELEVTGSLPGHLDGRYLRIGPNPVGDPDPLTYHWFTGAGMVHGVRLRDGRAEWYRNRWVRSADVAAALGEQPRPGPIHAGMDYSPNTHVIGHAGRTLAVVEGGGRPYELTEELETVGPCDFDGTLPGGYTAHSKTDPDTGELHAVSYFWGWGNNVMYTVIGTDGRVRRTVDIGVTGSPMMHDFSLTENYVVVYDLPVVFDADKAMAAAPPPAPIAPVARFAMSKLVGRRRIPDAVISRINRSATKALGSNPASSGLPYTWDPKYPARVGVMPRNGGNKDVRWFDIEPCYVYHPMNAYEDGDQLVLDVVRHEKMFATDHYGPNEGPATLDRWTVDMGSGKVVEERLDDRSQEFPRVDERLTGKRHRYGYSVGSVTTDGELSFADSVVLKHDLDTGTSQERAFGPGASVSEFVFVPDSDGAAEDEGVLMGYVHEPSEDRSNLVVLDAGSLETVATVHLPARVPLGFHGSWVPDA